MRRYIACGGLLLFLILSVALLIQAQARTEIPLWPQGDTVQNGITEPERRGAYGQVFAISQPSIVVYEADKPSGKAVLVCPGGGYLFAAMHSEGHDLARWFAQNGVTCAVLKYRMPNAHHEIPLRDVHQAMRYLRSRAKDLQIEQLGIMGFSAGGHLASTAATQYTPETRPDFQILVYPVISMELGLTHAGSRHELLGMNPSEELVKRYTNYLHVTPDTPPALIFHCSDDKVVPVENSLLYYRELQKHHVPAAMHIYPKGAHGWGFRSGFRYFEHWTTETLEWLRGLELPQR